MPKKLLSPEKLVHHVLLLFCPLRDEKEFLSGFPPNLSKQNARKGVQDVVNIN